MVRDLDIYLGLTKVYEQWLIEQAVYAQQDHLSVRGFADRIGISKSSAHRLLHRAYKKATAVREELGE